MIFPLWAAAQTSALKAEQALDRAMAKEGRWIALRRFAAPDAVMFAPAPVPARSFLAGRKNMETMLREQPSLSFRSCDGVVAIHTGFWHRPDGGEGYFTTVWQRQGDGTWKWVLDFTDELPRSARTAPNAQAQVAACGTPLPMASLPAANGRTSPDRTVRWWWTSSPTGRRTLAADYWDGTKYHPALADQIAPK